MIKKLSFYTALLLSLVVIIGLTISVNVRTADANPSIINAYFTNATSSPDWMPRTSPALYTGTASTSMYRQFITTSSATTSFSFQTENVDTVYVPVSFTASSSASVLQMRVWFSYNNSDWYAEDAYTVTSNILYTHASTTLIHAWTPSTTATSTKVFVISNVGARYTKIGFDVTGANGSLWYAAFTKSQK